MSSNQPNSSPPSPATAAKGNKNSGGGAFYGMLRKTKKKTYSALRGGGVGGGRGRHHRNANLQGGAGEDDSSSDSSVPETLNFTSNIRNDSAGRSPFTPRGGGGRGGGDSAVEPARSFYFSPLNSWHDHHGQQSTSASGMGNGNFGNVIPQQQHQSDHHGIESIVYSVELALRQIVLCCAMFIVGTVMSDKAPMAYHALELSVVAWGTCLLIVVLGWFKSYKHQRMMQQAATVSAQSLPTPVVNNQMRPTSSLMGPPSIERLERQTISSADMQQIFTGISPNGTEPSIQTELSKKRSHDEFIEPANDSKPPSHKVMREMVTLLQPTATVTVPTKHQPQQHPQLENLYVVLAGKQERIVPNALACEIDNELFSGKMLLMFRTPDVDEPTSSNNDPIVNYFRGKQRRFEFQWQLQLKKVPDGEVFLGAEVEEPIQMGIIQRALANAALKFTKKMNQGFSYYFSDTSENPSYLSFPVGTSMDRFSATKLGEPLPVLGQEVIEDPGRIKERKKGMKIEWDTDHVYTMALWSAYVDWSDWQILNFPGVRPFSVTSVIGVQPIILTLFTTPSNETTEKNPKRDIVFTMEVSNAAKSTLGSEAKLWSAKNAEISEKQSMQVITEGSEALEPSEIDSVNENETFDEYEDEDMDMDEQFEEDDLDKPMYEEDLEEEGALDLDNLESSCYLLSGTSISLREGTGYYVASGGGYAVLMSSPTVSIILEKCHPKKKKGAVHGHSTMIRNGDVVRVKLFDVTSKAVKFAVIHRGWWLRWTSARPKRNGLFYIRTSEPNGSRVIMGCPFSLVSRRWSHYIVGACVEGSAKYGGRMLGIYKTGKKSMEDDAPDGDEDDGPMQDNELDDKRTFKRMLPLLLCAQAYHSSDEDYASPKSPTRAKLARPLSVENDVALPMLGASGTEQAQRICDVPVWLEVMNRTKRSKQLVYAVRVKETALQEAEIKSGVHDVDMNHPEVSSSRMLLKLRTGRDLAPILRLGVEYKQEESPSSADHWQQRFDFNNQDDLNDVDAFSSSSDDSDSDEELDDDEPSHFLIAGPNHAVNETFASDQGDFAKVFPGEHEHESEAQATASTQQDMYTNSAAEQENTTIDNDEEPTRKEKSGNSVKPQRDKSGDSENADDLTRRESIMSTSESRRGSFVDVNSQTAVAHVGLSNTSPPFGQVQGDLDRQSSIELKKKSRGKAAIGRVAKTVKSSTVVTGKHVIKHSKNIGKVSQNIGKGTVKGTVSAGRAAGRVIPASVVYNYKPPRKHEPGGRVLRKSSDKSQMKMIGRAIKNVEGRSNFSASLLQLLAPDQSCRKVSQILFDISTTPNKTAQDAISLLARTNSTQDLTFLRGSSAELGVKPLKSVDPKFDVECVVARCIYEGRWREELCVLYTREAHIAFYAPLAKKPSLVVSFDEIMSARKCGDDTQLSPLPGLYALAIDTAWHCHYYTFLEASTRDSFLKRLNNALFHMDNENHPQKTQKVAQEFESYRMSLETSLTGTAGKWRAVRTGKKSKHKKQRRILNGRRMTFDLVSVTDKDIDKKSDAQEKVALYVENLLRLALSFSPNTLDASDSRFIEFLDQTSRLRTLPLNEIDLSSRQAFCIFVNLYHCLLQHSLLLALDGLPNKRSVTRFKRCSCYEIGDDVFSLAELECCVIRGKTSRPSQIKHPFVDAPKNSRPYRGVYGLGATDFRINFILNNGDMAYPPAVPVLQQKNMDGQIDTSASWFLTNQMKIDERKRTVFLPKVCDVYRNDFGMGDGVVCLSQCMIYLNNEIDQQTIESLLEEGVVSVKFQRACEDFHPNLTELH